MPTTISTTEMNYRDGTIDVREYDACHYMIVSGSMSKADKSGGRRLDGHENNEKQGEGQEGEEATSNDGSDSSNPENKDAAGEEEPEMIADRVDGEERDTSNLKPILYLKVTAMENMSVYVYGGPDRDQATMQVVPDNEMPTLE